MKLEGLVSATYTPFHPDSGELNLDLIEPMTEFMIAKGSNGFYVCGSTGEGESLSLEERKLVAEAYVKATAGRIPVIIQVGHNSITSARELAAHAAEIGADAISTLPPNYFKPSNAKALVDFIEQVTLAAPDLPYYYYHIPHLTGVGFDVVEISQLAAEQVPSCNAVKFSDPDLSKLMACQEVENGRYDIPFGCDEMMLGALACGAKAAVGSCYGFAGNLWLKIISAHEQGRNAEAHQWMLKAARMVRLLYTSPGPFHACVKQVVWPLLGINPGPLRIPQPRLEQSQMDEARRYLDETGWAEEIATGEFKLP